MGSSVYVIGSRMPLGFDPDLRHPMIVICAGADGGALCWATSDSDAIHADRAGEHRPQSWLALWTLTKVGFRKPGRVIR
jgi:hypothetical protein